MISDLRKLASAFIYGGYAAKKCGNDEKEIEIYSKMHMDFISGKTFEFPLRAGSVEEKFSKRIAEETVREHLYGNHYEMLALGAELIGENGEGVIDMRQMHEDAKNCAVHFYEVLGVNNSYILGEDIFSGEQKKLKVLDGLEKVVAGNIVSSHWGNFLERVDDLPDFKRYEENAREFFERFENEGSVSGQ